MFKFDSITGADWNFVLLKSIHLLNFDFKQKKKIINKRQNWQMTKIIDGINSYCENRAEDKEGKSNEKSESFFMDGFLCFTFSSFILNSFTDSVMVFRWLFVMVQINKYIIFMCPKSTNRFRSNFQFRLPFSPNVHKNQPIK